MTSRFSVGDLVVYKTSSNTLPQWKIYKDSICKVIHLYAERGIEYVNILLPDGETLIVNGIGLEPIATL